MNYFKHMKVNLKVAFHSLNDFVQHFVHAIIPIISWNHYHDESEDE